MARIGWRNGPNRVEFWVMHWSDGRTTNIRLAKWGDLANRGHIMICSSYGFLANHNGVVESISFIMAGRESQVKYISLKWGND